MASPPEHDADSYEDELSAALAMLDNHTTFGDKQQRKLNRRRYLYLLLCFLLSTPMCMHGDTECVRVLMPNHLQCVLCSDNLPRAPTSTHVRALTLIVCQVLRGRSAGDRAA
jgi:hypothetical protein